MISPESFVFSKIANILRTDFPGIYVAGESTNAIPGLKDLGGALGITTNLTQEFMDQWETLMEAYTTACTSGKKIWFCIIIPGLTKSLYFAGEPTPLGMPGVEVSSVLETTAYITPTGAPVWEAKPTNASPTNLNKSSKTPSADIDV